MRGVFLCSVAVILVHCTFASASLYNLRANVEAAVSRASTPYRSSIPAPASSLSVPLEEMWLHARKTDERRGAASLDCQAKMLQYEFSLRLQPFRAPLLDVFDSLGLSADCGIPRPVGPPDTVFVQPLSAEEVSLKCTGGAYYVSPVGGSDENAGTLDSPFATIGKGVNATRVGRKGPSTCCVILRAGTHFLADSILLQASDSGLIFTGYFGDTDPAWVSGGVPLPPSLNWTPVNISGSNIWSAVIPESVPITSMRGLNTLQAGQPPTRLFRAMFPDYDMEQFQGNLPGMKDVVEWVKPPVMSIPKLFYKDLAAMGLKNDSTMTAYNIYATGFGGPCAHWANDGDEWPYICSNNTDGGWEFIERGLASSGQLGFPIAMVYNSTLLPSLAQWTMPTPDSPTDWSNTPTMTVWHNQGWFQAIYAVTSINTASNTLSLSADGVYPAGGWQGGRTMENVDPYNLSSPMGSGPWFVSNVREELTAPGEYYFSPSDRTLYVFYNDTPGTRPPANWSLVVSELEVFFNLTGSPLQPVTDISFVGVAFRDQRNGQLEPWLDPSGGDWGLRRAGLLHFEGTERVNVSGCTFYRTDANAVFLSGYNRNATIVDSEFAYTGFSALVTFGRTVQDDGTAGEQPWGTVFAYCKVHELGTYQLQSSAWFTGKACLTRAEGNIMFNGPRAMININDGFGGGNNISLNSIFNTCRRSGDHGPINSWDRMPFYTAIRTLGRVASYSPADTETSHNAIIANYGASQGFDNDDGSSYYNTHDNWYYDASGFKMDYGGHNSAFHDNVVIASSGQNCIGTTVFVVGHEDQYYNNTCVVFNTERVDDLFENCDKKLGPGLASLHGYSNRYFTPKGNASATCNCCGSVPLSALHAGLEDNFTASTLPSTDDMIAWGRDKLML